MIRFKIHETSSVKLSVTDSLARMRVGDAVVVVSGGVPYDGPYEVTPKVEAQTLPTKQKYLSEDVHILSVPYYEADNPIGTTIFIASEV